MTHPTISRTVTARGTGLALLAGLAAGLAVAPAADALPLIKIRTDYDAWRSVLMPVRDPESGEIIGTEFRPVTGAGITIGMIEAAQPNLQHIAFDGLDSRTIWYPFENDGDIEVSTARRDLFPLGPGGGLRFSVDFHRHATAVAGVMVANNPSLFGPIVNFGPLIGIAPDADLLTGALLTEVRPLDQALLGITPAAGLFTIAAMTDIDFDGDGEGDFIAPLAEWYGVEPWAPASVINISFGRIDTTSFRAGEDIFARFANIIVSRTNTVIVAAVGDNANAPFLGNPPLDQDEGSIASPASAHNTIAVGRTGSGAEIEDRFEDSGIGPIPVFNWLVREGNEYLQDQEAAMPMDYGDINFMAGEDPREGDLIDFPEDAGQDGNTRVGIDILAPGTLITLPTNPANGSLFISNTDVWSGWEGTSLASAVVTGAVALMQEYGNAWDRSIDPVVIRAVLLNSAEKSQSWDNSSQNNRDNPTIGEITRQALDEEEGAGFLNFQRLLIQYETTAGGYADLTEDNQFILASFRPLFRRDPNILSPNAGDFGAGYQPNVPALESPDRYREDDPVTGFKRQYFYTDPDFALITAYQDPTGNMASGLRQAPEAPSTATEPVARATSAPAIEVPEVGPSPVAPTPDIGWANAAVQPIAADRFGFGDGGTGNRTGGTGTTGGTGNRTGTGNTGFGTGSRPGSGGGGGDAGTGGTTPSALRPCQFVSQTRCIRAGWDVGRLGIGFIDLPIGLLPELTDVTVTLTWNRTEDLDDGIFEELLNSVINADPPAPVTNPGETPSLARSVPPRQATKDAAVVFGPEAAPAVDRSVKVWEGTRPNRKIYPLVMAGETLRGTAPAFADLDMDKDGVPDAMTDTCFLVPSILTVTGVPSIAAEDSYDPLQIDMDGDGCGFPCDADDANGGIFPMNGSCSAGVPSIGPSSTFDSERLRRVSNTAYSTAVDEFNIDPVALSGVVVVRVPLGGNTFRFGTGVLIDEQRVITAAHILDANNDGVADVPPAQIAILFPTFNGNNGTLQYTGGSVNRVDINQSFNYIGDRRDDEPDFPPVENGRDDLAILTIIGPTFPEFIDSAASFFPYNGNELAIYPIFEAALPDAGTQEIIFAGYGESGDGRFGVPVNASVTPLPVGFVPIDLNPFGPAAPVMRVGKNVVDFFDFNNPDDDNPFAEEGNTELFAFDFDDPNDFSGGSLGGLSLGNRIESMITFGDSGSPSFIHEDTNMDGNVDPGELRILGINTALSIAAGETTLATFGSQGEGMILGAYTGFDIDGDPLFITEVLSGTTPTIPPSVAFNAERSQPSDLVAFKYDNLDLELRRLSTDGNPDVVVAQSQSANNVEHIYIEEVEDFGFYYARIIWAGPEFDWGGFQRASQVEFRIVTPASVAGDMTPLNRNDIVDFFPAEVKYGLAWWCDIPFDRIFENSVGRSAASSGMDFMGDMNGDLAVDATDIAEVLALWGTEGPRGDLSGNGKVDAADLMIMLENFRR